MKSLQELSQKAIAFRDARDWKQFHNPKDLAMSLVLEAGEVMEHFQWKNQTEIDTYLKDHSADIGEELADVLNLLIIMSSDFSIDILSALEDKMKKNELKYPISKSKGKNIKYNKL